MEDTQVSDARKVEIEIGSKKLILETGALAKQANLQIVFDAALVSGRTAPLVNARTSPRLVIERWLSGTNLIAEEQSRGVIVVRQDGGRKGKSLRR